MKSEEKKRESVCAAEGGELRQSIGALDTKQGAFSFLHGPDLYI